jgi:CHASE3 domain sensor protein
MAFWRNISIRNKSVAVLAVMALTHMLVGPVSLGQMGGLNASNEDVRYDRLLSP